MNPTSIQGLRGRVALLAAVCALAAAIGCGRKGLVSHEYVYVSAQSAILRDRLATVYNKAGIVKNGERLDVLEHQKRFVRVRTDSGQEGWIEERNVVPQDVYDGFRKLAAEGAAIPSQGRAITRASLNMHLTPERNSEHLYQLADSQPVELLKRGVGEKNAPGAAPRPAPKPQPKTPANPANPPAKDAAKSTAKTSAKAQDVKKAAEVKTEPVVEKISPPPDVPPPVMEDWWLVRDAQHHVGWVLARMVDLDVPLDVAQYAEGQRIVAAYVLNKVTDPGYEPPKGDAQGDAVSADSAAPAQPAAPATDYHVRPQYLMLLTEAKDGLPFDYNQARVFTWNMKRHRYETAYRERNLFGLLPVSVGQENFDKEGTLPTFTLHVRDENGQTVERKYKLNGPIVRRALAPGEQPVKMAALPGEKRSKTAKPRGRRPRR